MLNTNYAKTPFPLTRGYFKNNDVQNQDEDKEIVKKKVRKIVKKKMLSGQRRIKKKLEFSTSGGTCRNEKGMCRTEKGMCRTEKGKCRKDRDKCRNEKDKDHLYVCSICKKKQYKYRRNKLRHEKYECITGPQFGCEICGKKYSQKKNSYFPRGS
ncbi:unnamed protein product [Arctia plantaginis]|uniref:Uncharacterized protein n=1 Tax=Arctia plantaginis TaxID=874455 RepID=A0A8S1BLP4_ARCPL|nr:unnamed protein product [Arctia plantaginis]